MHHDKSSTASQPPIKLAGLEPIPNFSASKSITNMHVPHKCTKPMVTNKQMTMFKCFDQSLIFMLQHC